MAKFCLDHHSDVKLFPDILAFLEADDFKSAISLLRSHPPGPFSWNDWFPPVAFDHEDKEYVWVVWEALVERWYRLMRTAAGVRD